MLTSSLQEKDQVGSQPFPVPCIPPTLVEHLVCAGTVWGTGHTVVTKARPWPSGAFSLLDTAQFVPLCDWRSMETGPPVAHDEGPPVTLCSMVGPL